MEKKEQERRKEGSLAEKLSLARLYRNNTEFKDSAHKALIDQLPTQDECLVEFTAEQLSEKDDFNQLLKEGTPWQELEARLWQWYAKEPSQERGSTFFEWSFLYSNEVQALQVFKQILSRGNNIIAQIEPSIRVSFISSFVEKKEARKILKWLWMHEQEVWLTCGDRLLIFLELCSLEKVKEAWQFYQSYERELIQAQVLWYKHFQLSLDELLWQSSQVAALSPDLTAGIKQWQKIEDDKFKKNCQKKFLNIQISRQSLQENFIWTSLSKTQTYKERLEALEDQLILAFAEHDLLTERVFFLNRFFESLHLWFPLEEEVCQIISRLVIEYRTLYERIPNILSFFATHAHDFYAKSLEESLWTPWLSLRNKQTNPAFSYYEGVASLHLFLQETLDNNDENLWYARKKLLNKEKYNDFISSSNSWLAWNRWALKQINDNKALTEVDKEKKSLILRAAGYDLSFSTEDIEIFLNSSLFIPFDVLKKWLKRAKKENQSRLEWDLEFLYSLKTHLTYTALENMWQLAVKMNKFDLAWRVATVLKSRQNISSAAAKAWEISSEARISPKWLVLNEKDILMSLAHFNKEQVNLISQYYVLIKEGSFLQKRRTETTDDWNSLSVEYEVFSKIEQAMKNTYFNFQFRKRSLISKILEPNKTEKVSIPHFCYTTVFNNWSLTFLSILDLLGAHLWHWDLSQLILFIKKRQTDFLETKNPQKNHKNNRKKLSLSANYRSACLKLKKLDKEHPNFEIKETFICFAARLATMIYPNHYQALISLQKMQLPVVIIWDFERWLLSHTFSDFRQKKQLSSKVIIPEANFSLLKK